MQLPQQLRFIFLHEPKCRFALCAFEEVGILAIVGIYGMAAYRTGINGTYSGPFHLFKSRHLAQTDKAAPVAHPNLQD